MTDAVFTIAGEGGQRTVQLASYLDTEQQEHATVDARRWIKQLRRLRVDGSPFRDRFTYRDDSLWWFSEIFLHKQRVIDEIFRVTASLGRLIDQEQPHNLTLDRGDVVTRLLAPQVAAARRVRYTGPPLTTTQMQRRMLALNSRAAWLHTSALASRLRSRGPASGTHKGTIAAFVHRAFVRGGTGDDGSDEAYIGPVVSALEQSTGKEGLTFVTLGPAENFSARRWWRGVAGATPTPGVTIEALAPLDRIAPSRAVWRDRYEHRSHLWNSADLRDASTIGGLDCWPLIREELAGIALLQWPWSARAMDEAAAALDSLEPSAALTYAEAGGWGRALVLECRRRDIPSVGLQHGFIYRHWLNYLHDADEMLPPRRGFPLPDLTLLFDGYAEAHLLTEGQFPAESLVVTGSPRLDALVAAARALTPESLDRARSDAGAASRRLVLVVTKYREARDVLPALLDAAADAGDLQIAIKTHPAETPDVYAPAVAGRQHVSVLPASAPLAPLLVASRAIVTVNSTVALDAAVLGVPSLVIGLPNNLSPFVEAGVLAGADRAGMGAALRRILYDEEFRNHIDAGRSAFLRRYRIESDGRAAQRSAEAILRVAKRND
jgi:hypothetical protein